MLFTWTHCWYKAIKSTLPGVTCPGVNSHWHPMQYCECYLLTRNMSQPRADNAVLIENYLVPVTLNTQSGIKMCRVDYTWTANVYGSFSEDVYHMFGLVVSLLMILPSFWWVVSRKNDCPLWVVIMLAILHLFNRSHNLCPYVNLHIDTMCLLKQLNKTIFLVKRNYCVLVVINTIMFEFVLCQSDVMDVC